MHVQELVEPRPVSNGSLRERARPSACVQELVEPPLSNGSLRERTPPGMRVQELVEPRQRPNDSLRERSPPGVRVQESAESPSPMDELRQLAAELNRRLGVVGHGSGPSDGCYPVQPVEQGMPSVAHPLATVQRCGPMDERFLQRPIDEGTPSIVRPANYSARFDREQHVLVSRPRATPDCVQEHSRQEVKRYRAADQPPLGRVELAPLEPLYRYVQQAREGAAEQPNNRVLLDSSSTRRRMPDEGIFEYVSQWPVSRALSSLPSPRQMSEERTPPVTMEREPATVYHTVNAQDILGFIRDIGLYRLL